MPNELNTTVTMHQFHHRETRITLEFFPKELRPGFKRDVCKLLYLLPPWLQSLWIGYDCDMDNPASMDVDYEYRVAKCKIGSSYFEPRYHDNTRLKFLTHEFLHISLNPLFDYALGELKRLTVAESPHQETLREGMRLKVEACVQDLAHLLTNQYHRK